MQNKAKVVIIMGFAFGIFGFWAYLLMSYMGYIGNADISGAQEQSPQSTGPVQPSTGAAQALTGSQDDEIIINTGDNFSVEDNIVNLHMPAKFDNNGFLQLKKKLAKDKSISLRITTYDDMLVYQDKLLLSLVKGQNDVDVFLIPNDRRPTLEKYAYDIPVKTEVGRFFDYIFSDDFTNTGTNYMPYGIDPLITMIASDASPDTNNLNLNTLREYVLVNSSDKIAKIKIPLILGVDKTDIKFLENNRLPYPNYFWILYSLVYQAYEAKDASAIKTLIDLGQSDTINIRDPIKFKKLVARFEKKNQSCEKFPTLCLWGYGYADVIFGFLSDINNYEKNFNDARRGIGDMKIYNFPSISTVYPVRGRGFMINKNSAGLNSSLEFIIYYMQEGMDGNSLLWKNIFSAFTEIQNKQKLNNQYDMLIKQFPKFEIIRGDINLMSDFLSKTQIIKVLQGSYDINNFLYKTEWKF